MRILNRVVSWTPRGLTYEADPRHAELIIQDLGLGDARAVVTPGQDGVEIDGDQNELDAARATRYRAISARCNYVLVDRAD